MEKFDIAGKNQFIDDDVCQECRNFSIFLGLVAKPATRWRDFEIAHGAFCVMNEIGE